MSHCTVGVLILTVIGFFCWAFEARAIKSTKQDKITFFIGINFDCKLILSAPF
jgi:hypothetical protein